MLVKKNRRPQVRTRAIFGTDIQGNPGIKLAFCLEERPWWLMLQASKLLAAVVATLRSQDMTDNGACFSSTAVGLAHDRMLDSLAKPRSILVGNEVKAHTVPSMEHDASCHHSCILNPRDGVIYSKNKVGILIPSDGHQKGAAVIFSNKN